MITVRTHEKATEVELNDGENYALFEAIDCSREGNNIVLWVRITCNNVVREVAYECENKPGSSWSWIGGEDDPPMPMPLSTLWQGKEGDDVLDVLCECEHLTISTIKEVSFEEMDNMRELAYQAWLESGVDDEEPFMLSLRSPDGEYYNWFMDGGWNPHFDMESAPEELVNVEPKDIACLLTLDDLYASRIFIRPNGEVIDVTNY